MLSTYNSAGTVPFNLWSEPEVALKFGVLDS